MTPEALSQLVRDLIPSVHAKDIRLNLESLIFLPQSPSTSYATSLKQGASGLGLTGAQLLGVALSVAYSLPLSSSVKLRQLIEALIAAASEDETAGINLENLKQGAQITASLMAMNNIYYRGLHLADHAELKTRPARLRMNGMMNPGVPKLDYELSSLAVSFVNGCESCVKAHAATIEKHGLGADSLHAVLRLASVVKAAQVASEL